MGSSSSSGSTSTPRTTRVLTRRQFISTAFVGVSTVFLAACGATPTATPAPTATKPPATAAPAAPAATATTAPKPTVAPTAAATPKRGGTLIAGSQNDCQNFDPHRTNGGASSFALIYDTLIRWGVDAKGNTIPLPGLATEWTLDGSTATFKLRQGVKFHDGTDFNAEVAKFNLERMNDAKSAARAFVAAIKTIDIVDTYTIKLNLTGPSGSLLSSLSQAADSRPWIISKAMADKAGDKYGTSPDTTAGTGGMKLIEFVAGSYHVVQRTGTGWEKGADGQPLPYFDTMRWRFVNDDTVRATELRTGNIHWMNAVAAKDITPIQQDANLVAMFNPYQNNCAQFTFSVKSEKFGNLKLRQAVQYAMDRESMAKVLGGGFGVAHYWFMTPGYLGYDETLPHYTFDAAKAKQLVIDAGYPKGVDVGLMIINRAADTQQAQMMKQMLGDVGITVQIESLERLAWLDKVATLKFDLATYYTGVRPDPDSILAGRFMTGESKNQGGMSDPVIDDWLVKGRSSFDDKVRAAAYAEVQKRIFETAQYGTLWMMPYIDGFSKKVKGVKMLQGGPDVTNAWLE